ncbi:beta-lactamase domain protein [Colletotrichum truncatum]|uniref:Beta-lactamase domain protein n=1 Tax=Colletotrichum truncatum TaxID=5467 RepID=A0ACC3YI42_COLTU|nr:beta-lactamase domain protein [Colletotrichum truncatum]KAF6786092.1 beta-lactamase domain protein [Colletotrichum truncatum]
MYVRNPRGLLVSGLTLFSAAANAQIATLDQFFNKTTFPNEQTENVTKYLNAAADLAKTSFSIYQYYQDFCITQQVYPPLFQFPAGFVDPFTPFDRLIFVGHAFVSAWAYDTGDGLVLIDALDNPEEIDAILIPGLEKFGYKGSDIKHCIITHEHVDHYGGAKHLKDTYNTTLWAADAAWTSMANITSSPTPPSKDQVITDNQELTFGNVTTTAVLTPGHTPGTVSLIFPVFDKGVPHIAGMNGGTGIPRTKVEREQKIVSQNHFADVARAKGVDTLISNHQIADHSLYHADVLAHQAPETPNPFIIGVQEFENYMRINALCTNVLAARQGMFLDV